MTPLFCTNVVLGNELNTAAIRERTPSAITPPLSLKAA